MTHLTNPCPRMLTYRPPRIALSLLAAAGALHLATPTSGTWPQLPSSLAGGSMLAAFGFLIMLRAWWLFRAHSTAICPTAHTSALITNDIYRLTRNPMYLGIVLMLLGTAIVTGGWFFYLATLTFFLIINFVFCQYEEAKLIGLFGEEFARYRQSVGRWL